MQSILEKIEIVRSYKPHTGILTEAETLVLKELISAGPTEVGREKKYESERISGSSFKKVNRIAFLHGCRKAFVPSSKVGRVYGIRRVTIFELSCLKSRDIERSFDNKFSKTVEMVLEIESSEYSHKIEKFFNRNVEELLKLNGKLKTVNTIIADRQSDSKEKVKVTDEIYQVNIEFGLNNTDHDIKVMIKTLNGLDLLDDSLKKRINEKIIEQLFEVDFVQNILNKV